MYLIIFSKVQKSFISNENFLKRIENYFKSIENFYKKNYFKSIFKTVYGQLKIIATTC